MSSTPITGTVTLATGKAAQIVGSCSVRLVIGPWHDVVDCFVMNMASHHDLILGDSYLQSRNAVLSYPAKDITLQKGKRKATLKIQAVFVWHNQNLKVKL